MVKNVHLFQVITWNLMETIHDKAQMIIYRRVVITGRRGSDASGYIHVFIITLNINLGVMTKKSSVP